MAPVYFQCMKTLKCLLLSFCIGSQLTAQIGLGMHTIVFREPEFLYFKSDTLTQARCWAYLNEFEHADLLLARYNARHADIHALDLHGQVLYWMQAFDRSVIVYEKAIRLFPEPSSLHLAYARVLYGLNRLSKSEALLKAYKLYDSSNVEADIMRAYIDLWNGKTTSAGKKAGLLLQQYPGNAEANDILGKIQQYTAPYFKTGMEFFSDDQPLKGNVFYAEAGVYKSWLFAPTVQVAAYQFIGNDNPFHSLWMQLSNTFQHGKNNKLKVKVGVFTQNSDGKAITGSAEFSRTISKSFSLQAAVERRPYQYTVNSLKGVVMENTSLISLHYNRNEKWLGKAGYELLQYKDDNKVHTAFLWVLTPVIAGPRYSISGGYAFRYADAINNNFVPIKPIPALINSQSFENIAGIYSPYFTPENQTIHSALASANVRLTKKLQFKSRVNIGVVAKADNPYMWLDEPGGDFVVFTGYAQTNFLPATWVNELRFAASDKCSLAANYTYDKILFYKIHKGSIELKYHFLK